MRGLVFLAAILDSGAFVTVIPPHVGQEHEVVPGEASKAGVMYEVANGEAIPNLGEKLLPVVTAGACGEAQRTMLQRGAIAAIVAVGSRARPTN